MSVTEQNVSPSFSPSASGGRDRLLNFVNDLPAIVWEVELAHDGQVSRFSYLSESAERILGYSREFLLRRESWSEMVHPDDRDSFWVQQKNLFVNGDRGTLQHRVVTKDGQTIPLEATITLVRGADSNPVAMHGITLDITERYRSTQRWKFLAQSSELLGESVEFESTLVQTTRLLVPEIADVCTIHLKSPEGKLERLAVVGSSPELEAMVQESSVRFPARADTQDMVLGVLKSRQSFTMEITDEIRKKYSISNEHLDYMKQMDIRSVIITPLHVRDEMLGVITLSLQGTRPAYTEEDRLFVEQLARQAALALYKSQLLAEARQEADRRRHLQERMGFLAHASAVLASTVDAESALKGLVAAAVPKIADVCVVVLLAHDGSIRPLIAESEPSSVVRTMARINATFPLPESSERGLRHILATGQPEINLELGDEYLQAISVNEEELEMFRSMHLTSSLFYPLVAHNNIYGALLLAMHEDSHRRFETEDISFAEEISRRAALAIYKSRLLQEAEHEIERRSRLQARLELLEAVSKVVSSSLAVDTLLERAAPVLAPDVADWFAVDLISETGNARRVLLYHSDSALRGTADEYSRKYGAVITPAMSEIIRTGEPVFIPTVTPQVHAEYGVDSARSEMLDTLGDGSFLLVPLHSRQRSLGTIGFHYGHSGRQYTQEDVEFALEVASHLAAGIDNAMLFTETKRQMAELESIYQSSAIGLALLGSDGRYLRVNDALAVIHQRSTHEHLGQTIPDILGSPGRRVHHFVEQVVRSGIPIRDLEISNVLVGTPDRTLVMSIYPIFDTLKSPASATGGPDGNVIAVSASTMDITERKRFEMRLEESREAAEVASRTKDHFIATLSHELRTPLTPVLATVELLAEDEQFPAEFQPFIDLIRRNIEIEARLIDDLLDMTRISTGKLNMREAEVDLHALIPDVIEICRHAMDQAKLQIRTELAATNAFVLGDVDRLRQVFWNLLHNATKFTPHGGTVTIRTRNDEDGAVIIEVHDTGRGIPREDLRRIFDPFEQEKRPGARMGASGATLPDLASGNPERKGSATHVGPQAGLGLGLAISKSIVQMHGGTIEATSEGPGKGSTFVIRLRAVEKKLVIPASNGARPIAAHSGGGRILFVDDHADTNAALKVLLERRGYQVSTAASVAGGLHLARTEEFDLLVSDIGLPDGDGTDLLRAIHQERPMLAIAVSGYGTESDVEKSHKAGFLLHLKKPVAFPELERAIAELLSRK